MWGRMGRAGSGANSYICSSQLVPQRHRRRGMQGACGGTADHNRADIPEVSDDVGANEKGREVEPTFVSVSHSLRDNGIGNEGAKALAAALQTNTTLTSLS
jgi:hypothetical protein